jgi:hypothetical protein
MAKRVRGRSRVVLAPAPQLMAGQQALNRVLSVKLKPGEVVQWLWTCVPGGRYVGGYRIFRNLRTRNGRLKLWFDQEGDFLEVMFEQRPGNFRETANPHVMEKVDEQGDVLGFSAMRVSALRGTPLEVAL